MPNILVKLPVGVFNAAARATLVAGINSAAAAAEQIPDEPKKRMLCWVVLEEVAVGNWTCGGVDMSAQLVPVLVQINVPHGVLDAAARAQYVAAVQQAVTAALPDDTRHIICSCLINEVDDGNWGVRGMIWHLRDFAEHAGFLHLQNLMQ